MRPAIAELKIKLIFLRLCMNYVKILRQFVDGEWVENPYADTPNQYFNNIINRRCVKRVRIGGGMVVYTNLPRRLSFSIYRNCVLVNVDGHSDDLTIGSDFEIKSQICMMCGIITTMRGAIYRNDDYLLTLGGTNADGIVLPNRVILMNLHTGTSTIEFTHSICKYINIQKYISELLQKYGIDSMEEVTNLEIIGSFN
jgi:hypothetical protein